jgi:hypothetical protein
MSTTSKQERFELMFTQIRKEGKIYEHYFKTRKIRVGADSARL